MDESQNGTKSNRELVHDLSRAVLRRDYAVGEELREWLGRKGNLSLANQARICEYVFGIQAGPSDFIKSVNRGEIIFMPYPPKMLFHSDQENGYTNADVLHEVVGALCRMWCLPPYEDTTAPVNPNPDMCAKLIAYLRTPGDSKMLRAVNYVLHSCGHPLI